MVASLAISDWLPPALCGITFTALGLAKVYGFRRGIMGGGGKPWDVRACGSCPTWSRKVNIFMVALLLVIGLGNLIWLGVLCFGGRN